MKTIFTFAALIITSLLLIWGCSDKNKTPTKPESPPAIHIQIVIGADTLRFLPGDSAVTCGFVIVTDANGHRVAGVAVDIYLSQLNLGFIEYRSPLRDTTDAYGVVPFCYHAIGHFGRNVIVARYSGAVAWQAIALLPIPAVIPPRGITIVPDTLYIYNWWQEDSALVTVCPGLVDTSRGGVGGVLLPLFATGGRMSALPPLDSTGCTRCYWYTNHEPPGRYCLRAWSDTACVVVIDTTGGG